MEWEPFTKRQTPKPDKFVYKFSPAVRQRIMLAFKDFGDNVYQIPEYLSVSGQGFQIMMQMAQQMLERQFGALTSPEPFQHFMQCSDGQVIDFIEACFRTPAYQAEQPGVNRINAILLSEGIGFEFTPYVQRQNDREWVVEYPEGIVKTNELVQQNIIAPTFDLLRGSRWATTNAELLAALHHFREGNWREAIWRAGGAFETALKTICNEKQWTYQHNKATLTDLLQLCRDHNLFFDFYNNNGVLLAGGHIRNKMSGHGPEPQAAQQYPATREYADHMIHVTCANILLVARLAGIG